MSNIVGFEEEIKLTRKNSEFIDAFDFEVYDIPKAVKWLCNNRHLLYGVIGIYLTLVYFGQKWMKNRPAYNLSRQLFFWNLGLAVFSVISTARAWPELGFLMSRGGFHEGIHFAMCNRSIHNFATSFWGLMFLASKFVELGDTAFIVLRKQKLITLHWFHHVATLLLCWYGFENYQACSRFFIVNTFVHSFMYSYYALKALKVKIPVQISKALTTLQISQMFFFLYLIANYLYVMASGLPCQPATTEMVVLCGTIISCFTVLFVHFFRTAYSKKDLGKAKKA